MGSFSVTFSLLNSVPVPGSHLPVGHRQINLRG
ncbi:unnamed protein product [Gulo gulo]|uniref:Uncharacterized protein n=1 Tax=Gulo gulo TaxID=48420 RepID=A0A9X9LXR5_GULGU|nr:unnamed protein product [Gulo gulo]